MIFCARATRGLGKPSLDARSGRSISPYPSRETSELGGDGKEQPGALLAHGTRTIRMSSTGTRARLGALGGWAGEKLRAVKGNCDHFPREMWGIRKMIVQRAYSRIGQATLEERALQRMFERLRALRGGVDRAASRQTVLMARIREARQHSRQPTALVK